MSNRYSRMLRGGSWSSLPINLRSSYCGWDNSNNRNFNSGFRVFCSNQITQRGISMKEEDNYRRISISVSRKLADRVDRYVPWGQKGKIMESLLEKVVTDLVREGQYILADLTYGSFTIQYDRLRERAEKDEKDGQKT